MPDPEEGFSNEERASTLGAPPHLSNDDLGAARELYADLVDASGLSFEEFLARGLRRGRDFSEDLHHIRTDRLMGRKPVVSSAESRIRAATYDALDLFVARLADLCDLSPSEREAQTRHLHDLVARVQGL